MAAGADPVWRHLGAEGVNHLKAVGVHDQHLGVVAITQQTHCVAGPEMIGLENTSCLYTVCLLLACLLACCKSKRQCVSQEPICSDNLNYFPCCHTEIETADQTCYLTRNYIDSGLTSPCVDLTMPGIW